MNNVPKVGDKFYVKTAIYLSRGRDDFSGGLCTVSHVKMGISAGESVPFVTVKERPGTSYNWTILGEEQTKLKAEYGDRVGHADPDHSPKFNQP